MLPRMFLVIWLLFSQSLFALTATVDRTIVQAGDSFTLYLTETDSSITSAPDLSGLEADFKILGNSTSSQHKIINGSRSYEKTWQIMLIAKRVGDLTIPAIQLGPNQSDPIVINVSKQVAKQGEAEKIFLETELLPGHYYPNAQLTYVIKIFKVLDNSVQNLSITPPQLEGAIIEPLDKDRQYQSNRNGQNYSVIERRYAIFPSKSGQQVIKGPMLSGVQAVEADKSSRRNRFSSFFDDPFFSSAFNSNLQQFTRLAEDQTVTIKPIPSNYPKQAAWLPAQNVVISDKWQDNSDTIQVGDAVTHTITIQALGVQPSQLPEIKPAVSADIKAYPSPAKLNTEMTSDHVLASSEQATAYMATQAGALHVPETQLYWWNTNKDKLEQVTLAQRSLTVSAAPASHITPPAPTVETTPLTTNDSAENINPIPAKQAEQRLPWILLALSIAAWLLTVLYYRTKMYASNKPKQEIILNKANNNHYQSIAKSCKTNDSKQCADSLLAWFSQQHPSQTWLNLASIIQFLPDDEPLKLAIVELESALYSKEKQQWQGQALWKAYQAYSKQKPVNAKETPHLPPLYPIMGK